MALLVTPSDESALRAQDIEQLRRQAEQVLGRPISNQEALQLLQQSGLTSTQVRDLLQDRGYPRTMADPYLAVLAGEAENVPTGTNPVPLVDALSGTDLLSRLGGGQVTDPLDLLGGYPGLDLYGLGFEEEEGPPIFGRALFRRATTQFQPSTSGPAPADYRVGPEDELILVITGDVEVAYRMTVSREGLVVVPDLGRVEVAGATIGELRERFTRRLSEVYSGLTGDADATTFLDLSLGKLRTNLIYVIGEVERPGGYEIAGFASVFAALYQAGGPNRTGSFRHILVNRGQKTLTSVDLYDYLLDGRGDAAPRLEHGDVIFVPVADHRVEVDGAIVRPGIYELTADDDLADVIGFAGGLTANASGARVQIERTLPPLEQQEGLNRVLLDVPLSGHDAERGIPLVHGDRITVFAVLDDLRNSVRITGGVWRPGAYGVEPSQRLWDVIELAGGLLPDAYEGRVQIQRLQDDYTRRMIHVSLARDASGLPLDNPPMEPLDQVYVFARRDLREQRAVSIGGWVRAPGVYPYVDGLTVRDLILRAGGLRTGAFLGTVDIARVAIEQVRGDTITHTFAVALDSAMVFDALPDADDGAARAHQADFVLHNLDAVYVRRAPGFEPQRRVVITGEVMFPGPYSLQLRTERLTDLIARAGGLTPEAYPEGLQLWRAEEQPEDEDLTGVEIAGQVFGDTAIVTTELAAGGADSLEITTPTEAKPEKKALSRKRVGVDYVAATQDFTSTQNVLVEPYDSVFVPRFIPTVDVQGAVQAPARVLYKEGEGAEYYVRRAGGYQQKADKGRALVQFANGEVVGRGARFLFFGGGLPNPDPGAVVKIPFKEEKPRGVSTLEILAIITGMVTATATVIIAATATN
jgi:protein involved in polysaccharide export with SLBB domain